MFGVTRWLFLWLLALALLLPSPAAAQDGSAPTAARPSVLQDEITKMDAQLFDAFNRRDIATQKSIFAKDIEFYHDKGGVTNYEELIRSTEQLFAQNNGLTRTLIPGSQEVYPISNYGAIQIGAAQILSR